MAACYRPACHTSCNRCVIRASSISLTVRISTCFIVPEPTNWLNSSAENDHGEAQINVVFERNNVVGAAAVRRNPPLYLLSYVRKCPENNLSQLLADLSLRRWLLLDVAIDLIAHLSSSFFTHREVGNVETISSRTLKSYALLAMDTSLG